MTDSRPPAAAEPTSDLPPYTPSDIPTLFDLDGLLRAFDVGPTTATSLRSGHGGVLGAQMLGQYVALAERRVPGKRALTVQASFLRGGRGGDELAVESRLRQEGRTFAVVDIELRQREFVVSHADVLLHVPEAGALRGSSLRAEVPPPEQCAPVRRALMPWELRAAPDGATLWQRISDAGPEPTMWRALLAHTTEIPGLQWVRSVAREQNGTELPELNSPALTGSILSQRVSFLEELDVRDWHRINVDEWWAEYGRVSVRGSITDRAGRIAVTFEQAALLREATSR